MTHAEFLGVFQRKELGLKLSGEEVTALQSTAGMGGAGGTISYREFMYGDSVLDHFSRISQFYSRPYAPCDVPYSAPVLARC